MRIRGERDSLRSLHLQLIFLSEGDHRVTMGDATVRGHLMFHVERAHTAAAEGDVNNLLMHGQNFSSQCGHVHTLCESFSSIK